ATSSCGSEVLTVLATSTPPTPPATSTPGTIGGEVFNDLNKSGTLDAGDTGLAGFVINLHKGGNEGSPVIANTTTDTNGNYSFGSLTAGTYYVEEINQSGWRQTSSDTKVVLSTTTTSGTVNFANVAVATSTNQGQGNNHRFFRFSFPHFNFFDFFKNHFDN